MKGWREARECCNARDLAEFQEVWRLEQEQGIESQLLALVAHLLHVAHCEKPHPSPYKILTGKDEPEQPAHVTKFQMQIAAGMSQLMSNGL